VDEGSTLTPGMSYVQQPPDASVPILWHTAGCSKIGTRDFSTYAGDKSIYQVHQDMALDASQAGYFITQVGLSASSFGVATADVEAVGKTLRDFVRVPACTAGGGGAVAGSATTECLY
jgi:hypothetical protein